MLAVDEAFQVQSGRGLARARVFASTRRGARGEVPHRARGAGERLAGVLPERRRPLARVRGRCVGRRVGLRPAPAPLFFWRSSLASQIAANGCYPRWDLPPIG